MLKLILLIVVLNQFCLSMRHESQETSLTVGEAFCDDGRQMLEIDWDGSAANYTCFQPSPLAVQAVRAVEQCHYVPPNFSPQHFCMDTKITYPQVLPTHEGHRPVWPVFGEYVFLPPQRWLHSVEHGGLVMLYHPCADPKQVSKLRQLVVNCIRKHIITANSLLPTDRPLALIAWGCRLAISKVDARQVVTFIRQRAMKSPEASVAEDGAYDHMLIKKARIAPGSDFHDSILCPRLDTVN